jgi:hypothetical protein
MDRRIILKWTSSGVQTCKLDSSAMVKHPEHKTTTSTWCQDYLHSIYLHGIVPRHRENFTPCEKGDETAVISREI